MSWPRAAASRGSKTGSSSSRSGRDRGRGAPAPRAAGGHHQRDRLADEVHLGVGEQRLVLDDAADLVGAGDVGRGEHRHAAAAGLGEVQPADPPAGDGRGEQGRVQAAGRGEVVDELRCPTDVHRHIPSFFYRISGTAAPPQRISRMAQKCARTSWPSSSFL